MKKHFLAASVAVALCISATPQIARANLEVSAGVEIHAAADFHAPLAAHGTWVTVGAYGSCWHPSGIAVGWRPYCYGHWVWTDCGWFWESDEPWAWAVYHYGSWVDDPGYGWVWVPDVEWAPAWVYWRSGGGYCGWAPRAPHGVIVRPDRFAYVQLSHFHDRIRPNTVIVNNTTIINKTKVINNTERREERNIGGRQQRVVVNEGPAVAEVSKATGHKLNPTPVRQAAEKSPPPAALVNHKSDRTGRERVTPPDAGKVPTRERITPDNGNPPAKKQPGVREQRPEPKSQPKPEPQPIKPAQPVQPAQPAIPRPVEPPHPAPVNPPNLQPNHPAQPPQIPPANPPGKLHPAPAPAQPAPHTPGTQPRRPHPGQDDRGRHHPRVE